MLVIRASNCLEDVSQGPIDSEDGDTGKSVTLCHAVMAAHGLHAQSIQHVMHSLNIDLPTSLQLAMNSH